MENAKKTNKSIPDLSKSQGKVVKNNNTVV